MEQNQKEDWKTKVTILLKQDTGAIFGQNFFNVLISLLCHKFLLRYNSHISVLTINVNKNFFQKNSIDPQHLCQDCDCWMWQISAATGGNRTGLGRQIITLTGPRRDRRLPPEPQKKHQVLAEWEKAGGRGSQSQSLLGQQERLGRQRFRIGSLNNARGHWLWRGLWLPGPWSQDDLGEGKYWLCCENQINGRTGL